MDLPLHLTMPVTLLRSHLTTAELDTLLKPHPMTLEPVTHLRLHLTTLEPVMLLKPHLMTLDPVTLLKSNRTLLKSNRTLLRSHLMPHKSHLTLLQLQLMTPDPVTHPKSNLTTQEPATPLRPRLILTLDPSQTTLNLSHRLMMPAPAIPLLQLSHNKKLLQFTMPEQEHQQLVVTQSRATSGRQSTVAQLPVTQFQAPPITSLFSTGVKSMD